MFCRYVGCVFCGDSGAVWLSPGGHRNYSALPSIRGVLLLLFLCFPRKGLTSVFKWRLYNEPSRAGGMIHHCRHHLAGRSSSFHNELKSFAYESLFPRSSVGSRNRGLIEPSRGFSQYAQELGREWIGLWERRIFFLLFLCRPNVSEVYWNNAFSIATRLRFQHLILSGKLARVQRVRWLSEAWTTDSSFCLQRGTDVFRHTFWIRCGTKHSMPWNFRKALTILLWASKV